MINYILLLLMATLITGNNSAILSGPYRAIAPLRKMSSVVIITGMAIGLIVEGYKLSKFTSSFMVQNSTMLTIVIITTILLIFIGNYYKIPISLTMILAGGIVGIYTVTKGNIDIQYVGYLAIAWITYPFLGLIFSNILYRNISKIQYKNVWKGYILIKILILFTTLFLAYVFGANTIGLIYSLSRNTPFNLITFVLASLLGYLFLGKSVSYEVGLNIYNVGMISLLTAQSITIFLIEMATQFGIPVSLTQLILISLIGPATRKDFKIINIRYIKRMVILWLISPLIGYITSSMILIFFMNSGVF